MLLKAEWANIRQGIVSTQLGRATSFLTADYKSRAAYWEPLEMLRKLVLTGFVLRLPDSAEMSRLLVAITMSIAFLALQLSIKPFKRVEDDWIAMMVHLALVLIFLAAMLLKACKTSEELCSLFGFGSTGDGIFLFFVFFTISMLVLLIFIGISNLYLSANVPKIIMVARTHSISPTLVLKRALRAWFNDRKRFGIAFLGLDVPRRLHPPTMAAVWAWRARHRLYHHRTHSDLPSVLWYPVKSSPADVHIKGVFPHTTCAVSLNPSTLTLSWSMKHFISLLTVSKVALVSGGGRRAASMFRQMSGGKTIFSMLRGLGQVFKGRHPGATSRMSGAVIGVGAAIGRTSAVFWSRSATVELDFLDIRGVPRTLVLGMPITLARTWHRSLTVLLQREMPKMPGCIPRWRWALACMVVTNEGGALIRRADFHSLCEHANIHLDDSNVTASVGVAEGKPHRTRALPQQQLNRFDWGREVKPLVDTWQRSGSFSFGAPTASRPSTFPLLLWQAWSCARGWQREMASSTCCRRALHSSS